MGENSMRRVGLQPQKCTAMAKSTNTRCQQWAVVGARVCYFHGGGRKDVRANGDLRATAAQLGVIGLPPGDTIRLVQRALSERMLDAAGALRAASEEGRSVSPEIHEQFLDASDRALVAARIALAAGVEDQDDARDDESGELLAKAVSWSIDGVLNIVPGLSREQRQQARMYGLELAKWAFEGGDPTTRPEAPKLLPSSVAVAELMPGPARRRAADADSVWRQAQEVVDAEVVDDEEGDDGDGIDPPAVA